MRLWQDFVKRTGIKIGVVMEWTPPFSNGIEVPKWRCEPTT